MSDVKKSITVTQGVNKVILDEDAIVNLFHHLYYYSNKRAWENTFWLGNPVLKCPLDTWIYQEIIYEVKPDFIIETGTYFGGSALFMASICDALQHGEVITIDVDDKGNKPQHPRIKYIIGSSTSKEIVAQVKQIIGEGKKVMVILDSEHRKEHVLSELKIYSRFISSGSYLIVEDSNINGHPVRPEWGPGPMEAIEEFLKDNKVFTIDRSKEKYFLTQNPKGYLKKI